MQRGFTQGWPNYYHSLSALSGLYIVLQKQSDELSWRKMFVILLSRELYRDYIVVCIFGSHGLCCVYMSISFSHTLLLLVYLCNKFYRDYIVVCIWFRLLVLRLHVYPLLSYIVVVGILVQQARCICICSCWCSFCLSFLILFSFS